MSAETPEREKRRVTFVALILSLVALGGCALFEKKPPPVVPPPPEAVEPASPPLPAEPPPPRPARKPRPPSPGNVSGEQQEPLDPERLIGLGQEDAENWLGHPSDRTEAAPAQIWHYLGHDCQIDVYFYLDLQSKVMRALHYDVRNNDNNDRGAERCFQQIVAERHDRDDSASANRPR